MLLPLPPLHPPYSLASTTALSTQDYSSWNTEEMYKFGTKLLRYGDRFTEAIKALEAAVAREPNNATYQSALGCAYASRYASLSTGLTALTEYPLYLKMYEVQKARWERSQGSPPTEATLAKPEPEPPALPNTPDDNKVLTAPPYEVEKLLVHLCKQSLEAFAQAHTLSASLPAAQQAETEHLCGWGLLLLNRYTGNMNPADSTSPKPEQVTGALPEKAVEAFQHCVQLAPDTALYWQSLGVAYVPTIVDAYPGQQPVRPTPGRQYPESKNLGKSLASLAKSLALKPRNVTDVRYLVAVVKAFHNAPDAGQALEEAARQSGNATVWYFVADLYLQQAAKQREATGAEFASDCELQGVRAIRNGNGCTLLQDAPLNLPVPLLLTRAWHYRDVDAANTTKICESSIGRLSHLIEGELSQNDDSTALDLVSVLQETCEKAIRSARIKSPGKIGDAGKDRVAMAAGIYMEIYNKIKADQMTHPTDDKNRFLTQNAEVRQEMKLAFEAVH